MCEGDGEWVVSSDELVSAIARWMEDKSRFDRCPINAFAESAIAAHETKMTERPEAMTGEGDEVLSAAVLTHYQTVEAISKSGASPRNRTLHAKDSQRLAEGLRAAARAMEDTAWHKDDWTKLRADMHTLSGALSDMADWVTECRASYERPAISKADADRVATVRFLLSLATGEPVENWPVDDTGRPI